MSTNITGQAGFVGVLVLEEPNRRRWVGLVAQLQTGEIIPQLLPLRFANQAIQAGQTNILVQLFPRSLYNNSQTLYLSSVKFDAEQQRIFFRSVDSSYNQHTLGLDSPITIDQTMEWKGSERSERIKVCTCDAELRNIKFMFMSDNIELPIDRKIEGSHISLNAKGELELVSSSSSSSSLSTNRYRKSRRQENVYDDRQSLEWVQVSVVILIFVGILSLCFQTKYFSQSKESATEEEDFSSSGNIVFTPYRPHY